MKVIFTYMVKYGEQETIEEYTSWEKEFHNKIEALMYLETRGYKKYDNKNYKKEINNTLYEVGTLVKL